MLASGFGLETLTGGVSREMSTFQHWWIPSPEQIRPSAELRAIKDDTLIQINREYRTPIDFVLSSVFEVPTSRFPVRPRVFGQAEESQAQDKTDRREISP